MPELFVGYMECFSFSVSVKSADTHLAARLAAPEVADRDPAESVSSSTYWSREDDLDIEYWLIFQQNANLMLTHCLRLRLNINPTLMHVAFRVWWDVVGAVCDISCKILGHQTCVV